MKNCRDSGWHCLPPQVDFYMQQADRGGQITWVVLSWAVVKLKVSLCESFFAYGSPQLWETLTESLGTFVPSSGFWLTVWIFSKFEDAESYVQPLSYSFLLRFASFLSCDPYKSATTREGRQRQLGGSLLCPTFPFRMLAQVIFPLQDCEIAKSSAQLLSLSALDGWRNTQCLEGESSAECLTHFCAFPFPPWPQRKSWLHWELSSPVNQVVSLCLTRLF